jgi:hypothetical protein
MVGRMAANRLAPRCGGGVADVARAVCGIQAQDAAAARLSVRVRSEGLVAGDVDRAEDVVRVWAWRGTLHLLAREDVPWVLSLVAPGANRSVAARWRTLGLDDGVYGRARDAVAERLADGPATRAELRAALETAGVDASGQRLPHLLRRAALEGMLHHPLDGTFAALGPLADPPPREQALEELGRRYAAAYGPADARDLAAWSGLPAAEARTAWREADAPAPDGPAEPVVRLLPAFDTYLLGYRSRDHAVPPEHARRVWPGGGWIHPVVLVDGTAAGTWRLENGEVEVDAFGEIPAEGLDAEAADVRRFLGGRGA